MAGDQIIMRVTFYVKQSPASVLSDPDMSSSAAPVLPFAQTLETISRLVTDPRLLKPRIGIVCGSGLSTLVSSLKDVVQLPYSQLQGFGESTGMRR